MSKHAANMAGNAVDNYGFAKISAISRMLHSLLPLKDRKKLLTTYRNCFSAKEAIEVLLSNRLFDVSTFEQALAICQCLVRQRFIIRAQPSENKAISALPSNVLSHRDVFSESPDSLYQFSTLSFSEDPSEKARRRAEQEVLARAIPQSTSGPAHRGSLSRVDAFDFGGKYDRRGTLNGGNSTTTAPIFAQEDSTNSIVSPALSGSTVEDNSTLSTSTSAPPTPSHAQVPTILTPVNSNTSGLGPQPPSMPPPSNVTRVRSRGKKLDSDNSIPVGLATVVAETEESKESKSVDLFEKPDFSSISSDTYVAPHTGQTKHLGQSIGKTPGGINIRVNVRQTSNASTLPRNPNLKLNVNPGKEYNLWYKDWCGFLEKKRDKGLNVSWYQRRYFRLEVDSRSLVYYSSPDETFPLGFIPLHDISAIHYVPDKRNGRRFDVFTYGRVYSLKAESTEHATQWVAALTACIQHLHLGQACFSKRRPPAQPKTPKTPNAMRFFWNPKNPLETINQQRTTGASATLAVSNARRHSFSTVSRVSLTRDPNEANPILKTPDYLRGLVDERGNSKVDSYAEYLKTGSVRYRYHFNDSHPLTTLRLLFYQLNYTISGLHEPDMFRALLDEFQTDDDIFQYLLDILLTDGDKTEQNTLVHPSEIDETSKSEATSRDVTLNTASDVIKVSKDDKYAIAAQTYTDPNQIVEEDNEAADSFRPLSHNNCGTQSSTHGNHINSIYIDDIPAYKRRHRRADSATSVEITASLQQGVCPSKLLPAVHDPALSPLGMLVPVTVINYLPELISSTPDADTDPLIRGRHRRARSEPKIEPIANTKDTSAIVADITTKREHFLHKISATLGSRSFASMSIRERTKTWLTSTFFYQDVVCGPYITSYEKLSLPVIWTLLLARHHEEENVGDELDEDESYQESEHDYDSHMDGESRTGSKAASKPTYITINTPSALLANTSILGLLRHMKSSPQQPPLIRLQKHLFTTIPNCIVAKEFVDWLVKHRYCDLPDEGVVIGNLLVSHNILYNNAGRKFKRNTNLWAVQDISGLIGLLDNVDSPFKEKRWGNMVAEDGSVFGIQTQAHGNKSSGSQSDLQGSQGNQGSHDTNPLNYLPGFNNGSHRYSTDELNVMHQRLQGSWLNSVSLAQLITGLSPKHWRTKWTPSCRSCQQAAAHFTELISRFCSFFSYLNPVVDAMDDEQREYDPLGEGSGMDLVTTNSVLSLLVTAACDMSLVQSPVRDEFSVFSRAVQNAGVWRALFSGLYATAPHLRRRALQHVSGLLVCMPQGLENALSLSIVPCWGDWVLSMLDDIDATNRATDRVREKVFKFAMNIIAMVLHELLMSKECAQDEEPSNATDNPVMDWAAPMIALPNEPSSNRGSFNVSRSASHSTSGIEMIDPQKPYLHPQDATRMTQMNNGRGGTGVFGPSTVNINSVDVEIDRMTSNANPNLAPCIYPHRRAGFSLPLSVVGAASLRRPKCYKAQLLDCFLAAMSRSTIKDFSLARSMLTGQVVKISTKLRSRYSLPIHERLSQICFLMLLVRSFVFMVPLSPDGEAVASIAHATTLHIPASAFQLQAHVYNSHEDILNDISLITGDDLKIKSADANDDPNHLRKSLEKLQLFNEKAVFNGGVNNFGYGMTTLIEDNHKDKDSKVVHSISQPLHSAENSANHRSVRGRPSRRRESYSQSEVSRIAYSINDSLAGRATFNAELGGRQSIHASRHQMQLNIGSTNGYQGQTSISGRPMSRSSRMGSVITKQEQDDRDREIAKQEKLKEEQFKQAGGGLHWREKQGLDEDIDLLERALTLLRQLRLIEAPTLNFGNEDDVIVNTKQKDIRTNGATKAEIAAERENVLNAHRTSPQEVWSHLNMLSGHYAEQRQPTLQECEYIRKLQTVGDFFKESLTYLNIMKERLHILTPAQVTASTKEFVTMRNRHKIFTTKLFF